MDRYLPMVWADARVYRKPKLFLLFCHWYLYEQSCHNSNIKWDSVRYVKKNYVEKTNAFPITGCSSNIVFFKNILKYNLDSGPVIVWTGLYANFPWCQCFARRTVIWRSIIYRYCRVHKKHNIEWTPFISFYLLHFFVFHKMRKHFGFPEQWEGSGGKSYSLPYIIDQLHCFLSSF